MASMANPQPRSFCQPLRICHPHSMSCPEAQACRLSLSACWGPAPGGWSLDWTPWQPRGRLGGFSEESETETPCPPRCSSARVSELCKYKVVAVLAKLCAAASRLTNPQISLHRRSTQQRGTAPVGYSCASASADAATTHPKRTGWGNPPETVTLAVRCLRG